MTFLNYELFKKYDLESEYEDILKLFNKKSLNFGGDSFTNFIESYTYWGGDLKTIHNIYKRLFFILTPEEKDSYNKKLDLENNIQVIDSSHVKNSETVIDSKYVTNSHSIENSGVIKDSDSVSNSYYITDSFNVFNCTNIENVEHCFNSEYVKNSYLIISSNNIERSRAVEFSQNITDSKFIFHSNNIKKSLFCTFIKNSENKIFCTKLENDSDYMIFNKKVPQDFFLIIYKELSKFIDQFDLDSNDISNIYSRLKKYNNIIPQISIIMELRNINWRKIKEILPEFNKDFIYNIYPYIEIFEA